MAFFVYILKCSDDSYYIGQTDDMEKRLSAHQQGFYSGYTRKRLPVKLVFVESCGSHLEAVEYEQKIKRWSRKKKEALIRGDWDSLKKEAKKKFRVE